MKKIALLWPLIVAMAFSACSIDVMEGIIKASLDGKPLEGEVTLTFSNVLGDQITITITSLVPWSISEYPNWLEINPKSGMGAQMVTITVVKENSGLAPLEGVITFLLISGETLTVHVQLEIDPYARFKADGTPRWESGATKEENHLSTNTFITDTQGQLFVPSPTYKMGRITAEDGSLYEIIEFNGPPVKGIPLRRRHPHCFPNHTPSLP